MDGNSQTSSHDAEIPNDPGKMFVGGLSWQTTTDGLREYFNKYGEVRECVIMRDAASKRSRGFGFVTFGDPQCVEKVLANSHHDVDGKKVDPKVAVPKRAHPKPVTRTKKIFVGGLAATTSVEDLKNYFQQFGKVEDAMLMIDRQTSRHRGFGFVIFENEDSVEKVCELHYHEITNKMVECKKAQPKEVMLPQTAARNRTAYMMMGLSPSLVSPVLLDTVPNLKDQSALAELLHSRTIPAGYSPNFPFGRPFQAAIPMVSPYYTADSLVLNPGFTPYGPAGYMVPGAIPGTAGTADRRGTAGAFPVASYPDYGSAGPAQQVRPTQTRTETNNTMPQQDYNREQQYHQQPAGVINSYAPQSYAPSPSPVSNRGFNATNSPGPMDLTYGTSGDQNSLGGSFVQAASPQPSNFSIAGQGPALIASTAYPNGFIHH